MVRLIIRIVVRHDRSLIPDYVESEYTVTDHQIPVEGGEILARAMVPTPKEGGLTSFPVLVWFHGGGDPYIFLRVHTPFANIGVAKAGPLDQFAWTTLFSAKSVSRCKSPS